MRVICITWVTSGSLHLLLFVVVPGGSPQQALRIKALIRRGRAHESKKQHQHALRVRRLTCRLMASLLHGPGLVASGFEAVSGSSNVYAQLVWMLAGHQCDFDPFLCCGPAHGPAQSPSLHVLQEGHPADKPRSLLMRVCVAACSAAGL